MPYLGFRQIFGPLAKKKIRNIEGENNLPENPPFIVAMNHVSFIDPPVLVIYLLSRYKRTIYFPTTPAMWKFWGKYIARRILGMIPIYPEKEGGVMSEVISIVRQGEIVGIFPEGTRNTDKRLLKAKTGAVRVALETGVPLIPVGLVTNIGRNFRKVLIGIWQKKKFVDINIGRPVDLAEFKDKPIDKLLLETATRKLMLAIGSLCGKTYSY